MIDTTASDPITLNGACHCGAVSFTVELPYGLSSARRCTCSICRMRGAVAVTATLDGLKLLSGSDKLATYRFNTKVAEHHFCSNCGIYTHHRRRSNPDQLGVNVACLEGMSPFDFDEVIVYDGNLHPRDQAGGRIVIAGRLRFKPNNPEATA